MLIFFKIIVKALPCVSPMVFVLMGNAFEINRVAVLHINALCALNTVSSRIGSGQRAVMSEHNGFAVGTFEHCGYDIALIKAVIRKVIILALVFLNPLVKPSRLACKRAERNISVASVYAENL